MLPEGSLSCVAVVNPFLEASISPDLDWIPIRYIRKPREYWRILPDRPPFSLANNILSCTMETYQELLGTNGIARDIVAFAALHQPELLWCVVQGQTEVRLARKISQTLGIPLFIQIWDPLYFWMDTHIPNNWWRQRVLREFEQTVRGCAGFFAASWAMAEQYHSDYGVRSVPFLPSIDARLALLPAPAIHDGHDFIIGGAGKLYPEENWNALFRALDTVDWQIANRNVKIRLLAQDVRLHAKGKMNFEFLGWRSQEESIQLLGEADLLFCPYWFDPYYDTVTRLSFPGKLSTFLASGRPVMFHGPVNASPARFLRENAAGLLCHTLEPAGIIAALTRIIDDQGSYREFTHNGRKAFDSHLTLHTLRRNFAEFLQLDESCLVYPLESKR
jgi:glycosyltransferase involved in cell wall biosynthesis